ncbi:MAG: hypothetical protein IH948_04770, partial [Bacteroidetes bacterium]|nr:hypothetical protein [Bacteroidota bacterium]
MNKMFLILQREYLTRVMKKSFWIWTLTLPFVLGGSFTGINYLMNKSEELVYIQVIDETGALGNIENTETLIFNYTSATISNTKDNLENTTYDATLYLTSDVLSSSNAKLYFNNHLGYLTQQSIRYQ